MKEEQCSGAVVFKVDNSKIKYLLIQSSKWKYWGFPKGHVENVESYETSALREVYEETGLTGKIIPNFLEHQCYTFEFEKQKIRKTVRFFLMLVDVDTLHINKREHQDYRWVSCTEAEILITKENNKELLKKANDFLLKHGTLQR